MVKIPNMPYTKFKTSIKESNFVVVGVNKSNQKAGKYNGFETIYWYIQNVKYVAFRHMEELHEIKRHCLFFSKYMYWFIYVLWWMCACMCVYIYRINITYVHTQCTNKDHVICDICIHYIFAYMHIRDHKNMIICTLLSYAR